MNISDEFVIKDGKKLRFGFTTGTCACAASKAAAMMLLSADGERADICQVQVQTLKENVTAQMEVIDIVITENAATCSVIKDGGDDPDVTHGMKISATVSTCADGINIDGGKGVGRVTKKGLQRAIGQAAINKGPLKMINNELENVAKAYGYKGGFHVVISAENGETIAKDTFNPRLGIVGGISILGTTGIVEPMSEKALIATIRLEMETHKAQGMKTLLLTPGNYGQDFAKEKLNIDVDRGVKCSNFIGEALDHGVYLGFEKILLVGHGGKLLKLAGGIMNTHSKMADCRMELLALHCGLAGASREDMTKILNCVTVDEAVLRVNEFSYQQQVWESLSERISFYINNRVKNKVEVDFIIFTNESGVIIKSKRTEGGNDL